LTDIDECSVENKGGCSDFCNNTVGSYECFCPKGYYMLPDEKTCKGIITVLYLSGLFIIWINSAVDCFHSFML